MPNYSYQKVKEKQLRKKQFLELLNGVSKTNFERFDYDLYYYTRKAKKDAEKKVLFQFLNKLNIKNERLKTFLRCHINLSMSLIHDMSALKDHYPKQSEELEYEIDKIENKNINDLEEDRDLVGEYDFYSSEEEMKDIKEEHDRFWNEACEETEQQIRQRREQETIKSSSINHHKHIGRNDTCPCGSKKKYKKCCLKF